ncbi:MAG: FIST C-terminal domain-containing protein [Burkholderiales bacterium]|nr:FIST C-terminal domain-containing protein [Phycisphaerae bacterium]
MMFAAALSTRADPEEAVHEVIEQLHAQGAQSEQNGADPAKSDSAGFDLAIVFFTHHHGGDADSIAQTLQDALGEPALIGCSCEGVIGQAREVENTPGLSVLAARLPGVRVSTFHISDDQWPAALASRDALTDHLNIASDTRAIIGLGDPWTTPITHLLQRFGEITPAIPLIGGMASGARKAGENVILFNNARFDEGMAGVAISGPVRVETVVSQGCRPIGQRFIVTKGQANVIEQLGGKPALTVLEQLVHSLTDAEKQLLSNGLLIGQAMSEYKETFARGDFVVRSIVGVDQSSKALGVGDRVRVGQTVQFHVRDQVTADEDLNHLLGARQITSPSGALLFSCNGRGSRLFAKPHHDAQTAAKWMPDVPLAGFFAAGELGPVDGRNFIHGHTASFALFSTP